MNTQQELKQKADTLLALREDLYEMHFHQVDREWLIDAMLDFAGMNHMYFGEKSEKPINQTEISDIDIKKKRWEDWDEFNKKADYSEDCASPYADGFTRGAKWVLEQLKSRQ